MIQRKYKNVVSLPGKNPFLESEISLLVYGVSSDVFLNVRVFVIVDPDASVASGGGKVRHHTRLTNRSLALNQDS